MPRNDNPAIEYFAELPQQTIDEINKLPKHFSVIQIPIEILADDRLTWVQKTIFGFILLTDHRDNGHFWSNKHMMNMFQISQPTITEAYQKLESLGLIELEYEVDGNKKTTRIARAKYRIGMTNRIRIKESGTIKEIYTTPLKEIYTTPIKKLLANTSTVVEVNNVKEDKKENTHCAPSRAVSSKSSPSRDRASSRKRTLEPSIMHLVEYFKTACKDKLGFAPRVEGKDNQRLRTLLKDESDMRIKSVIDFALSSQETQWQRERASVSVFLSTQVFSMYDASKSGRKTIQRKSPLIVDGLVAERGKYDHLTKHIGGR